MKKIVLLGMITLVMPLVLADYGNMMGYGMMGGVGLGVYGVIWFVIAAFVFSVIFWASYKWIVKGKKGK